MIVGFAGVIRLMLSWGADGWTLIGIALVIEYMVRIEARMLEDGGYFDDGLFGYDFSEGYTSLEGGTAAVRPHRESALKRWRRRRSDLRRQRRMAREAAEERRMDEILEKLYREGRAALTDEENRFLVRVSAASATAPSTRDPDHRRIARRRPSRSRSRPEGPRRRAVPLPAARWSGAPSSSTRAWARGSAPAAWTCDDDDPCLWNLDRPEQVLDVHRRDARAGSRVLFTNTFGANRAWLARFGRGGDVGADQPGGRRPGPAGGRVRRASSSETSGPRPPTSPARPPSRPSSWSMPGSMP